jgi:hypothetical protein
LADGLNGEHYSAVVIGKGARLANRERIPQLHKRAS